CSLRNVLSSLRRALSSLLSGRPFLPLLLPSPFCAPLTGSSDERRQGDEWRRHKGLGARCGVMWGRRSDPAAVVGFGGGARSSADPAVARRVAGAARIRRWRQGQHPHPRLQRQYTKPQIEGFTDGIVCILISCL
ncbi:unnamed protein product, partial [Urochloa humidicola]